MDNMTEGEAKGFIQGKLDCMKKCDIFNKEDNTSDNDCDNCEYCYSQGNFGEQKEAFSVAIQALEKQIPKRPIECFNGNEWICECPVCKGITDTPNEVEIECIQYCGWCGQKLDWSDEE